MIILFGSNILDQFFLTADLPEKDQAIHLASHEERAGGKGANQGVAAARAGSKVCFFGAIGDGGHGRQMYKNLESEGVDVSGIEILEDTPSGLAVIFVDHEDGTHRVVVSQGANLSAKQDTISDDLLTKDTTVLVQRELPIEETEKLVARAKQRGARTIMNLAPAKEISENLLLNLDIIILNEHEANTLADHIGEDAADKWAFSKALSQKYNITTIVTLGGDGAICYGLEGQFQVDCLNVEPVDTIGAGDAFAGYLSASLDQGESMETALKRAVVAGSLTCTKLGAMTALPYKEEVDRYSSQVTLDPHLV